ncbi:hypothetical protein QWM81_17585 [Streptomyces ficellus]|uniref:Uncharacterized protein n=1 Tax=Streptomyces ficellus TaxID=1977088 RepID=A0ABT7Z8K8_9ACTN|nr:hypothetical protein [Streptomyces ficellus]MDN3295829.1 hypothetical protein [Streptomyces ficellus]
MKGSTAQALAVCSPAPGRLDVFLGTDDGNVWHKTFDDKWSAWHPLGRPWPSPRAPAHSGWLTATSSGPRRIELLALTAGGELRHRRLADGRWTDWMPRGVLPIRSSAHSCTVAAPAPEDLHLFFADGGAHGEPGAEVVHWRLDGGKASRHPAPRAFGRPRAVDVMPGCFDLVVCDVRRRRFLRRRYEGGWSQRWDRLEDLPADASPSRCFAATRRDLFTAGGTGLWHRTWDDTSHWENLGGDLTTDEGVSTQLAAVSSAPEQTHVCALWANAALMHRRFDGAYATWSQWELIDIWADTQGYRALRPDDLVALTVRGVGLTERVRPDGVVELVAQQPGARLIVELPPQHIAETVLTAGSSSQARMAGPSSLRFAVGQEPVTLTVDGVLAAMERLPLVATPDTSGTGQTHGLELPWRLLLALPAGSRCTHRALPAVSGDGTTELWHSRVTGPGGDGQLGVQPYKALPGEPALDTPLKSWTATIAALGLQYPTCPVAVDRLILSAYGAWFSASAGWPTLDWTHEAAMGRDYHVRVLKRGALFPFGHRASYVEMTERRFETDTPALAALRTKRMLIVTEPARDYGVGGNAHERAFPFQHVTVDPRQVTDLDEAQWLANGAFWPTQGGAAVQFTLRGQAGHDVVDLRLPLLFADEAATTPAAAAGLDAEYAGGPRSGGLRDVGRPTADIGRRVPLAMRTATQPLEGAVQEVQSMTFGGVRAGPLPNGVGFHPTVTRLELALPAVRQLLGPTPAVPASFSRAFLHAAAGAEPPHVLLDLLEKKVLDFGPAGARTGMLAAPTMTVSRLSRTKGLLVGDRIPTDPREVFPADAKLFGVVPLRDIISTITSQPQITWTELAGVPSAALTWTERLSRTVGPFEPGGASSVHLHAVTRMVGGQPVLRTTGEIKDFTLAVPSRGAALVILTFRTVRFTANSGERPGLTFDLADAQLTGELNFVRTLAEGIRRAGRGGPRIDVSAVRVRATYSIAVPTIPMGVFTLQNLGVDLALTLSLENRPILIDFAFGTRERPFLVTVSGFGGGGYLELGVSAGGADGGLQRVVGGIEFGASVAMDFGIAAGEVHVFGGVVFVKLGGTIEITGYLRIGGSVSVLGLVRVSVELTISLTYNVEANEMRGSAKLVITVDLTFWSTSVTLECHKSFKGPDLSLAPSPALSPTAAPGPRSSSVEAALGPQGQSYPWQTYCRAFAGE